MSSAPSLRNRRPKAGLREPSHLKCGTPEGAEASGVLTSLAPGLRDAAAVRARLQGRYPPRNPSLTPLTPWSQFGEVDRRLTDAPRSVGVR